MKGVGLDDPRTPGAGPMPWSSCARTMRSARCGTWSASRPSSSMASRCAFSAPFPGLENAEFARLGGIHRNSFIRSPELLDGELRLKAMPHIRFAGQITGCEGYVESAAIGLLAARFAAAELARRRRWPRRRSKPRSAPCSATSPAAPTPRPIQPMNVNFGLMPPLDRPQGQKGRPQAALHRPRARRAGRAGSAAEGRGTSLVISRGLAYRCRQRTSSAWAWGAVEAYSAGVSAAVLLGCRRLELVDRLHRPFLERQFAVAG